MSRRKKAMIMAILGGLTATSLSFVFQPPLWLALLAFVAGAVLTGAMTYINPDPGL